MTISDVNRNNTFSHGLFALDTVVDSQPEAAYVYMKHESFTPDLLRVVPETIFRIPKINWKKKKDQQGGEERWPLSEYFVVMVSHLVATCSCVETQQ